MLIACALGGFTAAHELRPAVADLEIDQSTLTVRILVNLEALLAGIGPEHADSDNSPNAQTYNGLRALPPAELEQQLDEFLPSLLQSFNLTTNSGIRLLPQLVSVRIPAVENTQVPRDSELLLEAKIPPGTTAIRWAWDTVNGPTMVRAYAIDDPNAFSQYVDAGNRSDSIKVTGNEHQSTWQVVLNFLPVGFTHIIPKGIDHILFVIGLFLLAPRWQPILWQVTSFTIAHTMTLALGMLNIISLPASLVEPLIALSIVVVCVENLFTDRLQRFRTAIVFGFGLLHGLGFAGVLSNIGLTSVTFISALVSFNIGVEAGQLTVIAVCFLLLGWPMGNKPWYRRLITQPASLVIATIGLVWFVERLLSGGLISST